MIDALTRVAPAGLPGDIAETEEWNGYTVALKYRNEKKGSPWIADLSHRVKLDFQCSGESVAQVMGIDLPDAPGRVVRSGEWLVSALGKTQFTFIHIHGKTAEIPEDKGFTDITDGRCLYGIGGTGAEQLMEKITRMNTGDPTLEPPCVLQGPMLHTFGQIHILECLGRKVFLINLGRGYARSIIHALMDIGAPYGLSPSGEDRFIRAITR